MTFLGFLILALITIGEKDLYSGKHVRNSGECTIGVFSGRATADGRPLLWKNRDVTRDIQKFCYYEPSRESDRLYAYIGNCYSEDTTRVYMGLNEVGFGIINSNSYNLGDSLPDGVDDGILLRMALERCRTIEQFEDLLELTAEKGRRDCWNIGVFDSDGNTALYECSNFDYVKFDANDPVQTPDGIILRATYGLSGGDNDRVGAERLKRANVLVRERNNEIPLDAEFVFRELSRDLANPIDNPYPLPYLGRQNNRPPGFILTRNITINRNNSRSCMVIRGNRPDEDPRLSTVFCSIGPPVLTVAYPLWVGSREVPAVMNIGTTIPMYSIVQQHMSNLYPMSKDPLYLNSHYLLGPDGEGIYNYTLPLEREAFRLANHFVDQWYDDVPPPSEFAHAQNAIAEVIYDAFEAIPLGRRDDFPPENYSLRDIENYPNPFNTQTTIHLNNFDRREPVKIVIFDIMGRMIKQFDISDRENDFLIWDGTDSENSPVTSGIYLIRAENSGRSVSTKALLMK